jgi:hypothetical protein
MNSLHLTGLKGSQPIGALAAFGLMRICSHSEEFKKARLSWSRDAGETAILLTEGKTDETSLVDCVLKHLEGRTSFLPIRGLVNNDASQAAWDDIKVDPDELKKRLDSVSNRATATNREEADYWSAFGSEMVTARSTGDVKPTAFHMTAGQQKFLKSLRELAESLDSMPREGEKNPQKRRDEIRNTIREALFGPWLYRDSHHSLGWDPVTEALYALSAIAPTDAGPRSVRAAVWLAAEALPLFPCFPAGRRLHTRGFNRTGDEFSWPLWFDRGCTIDALRSILALPLYDEQPPLDLLRAYGIERIYRSARPTDANGRGQFRSAVPVTE